MSDQGQKENKNIRAESDIVFYEKRNAMISLFWYG